MKILTLSKKLPFPSNDGESVAISTLAESLVHNGAIIDLLSFNTVKHFVKLHQAKIPNYYNKVLDIDLDNRVRIWPALLNLFSKDSYNISRFYSKSYDTALKDLLRSNTYDVVLVESIYMSQYVETIRRHSNALICLRTHNLEFQIWNDLFAHEKNPIKKVYLKILVNRLKRYEVAHLNKCDLLVSISDLDRDEFIKLGLVKPSITCPVGWKISAAIEKKASSDLFFLGSMDWRPNIEGLIWFLKNVFPIIKKERPETRIHLAGRNARLNYNLPNDSSIVMHGEVKDSKAFMESYSTMIVPLFSGSGIRVKIIEGLALGRAIVCTTKAIEGINATNGKELYISDDPNDFAEKCLSCLNHENVYQKFSQNGRSFINDNYQSDKIGLILYKGLLKQLSNRLESGNP